MMLRNLSASAFAAYGQLIEADPGNADAFQVIVRETEAEGWQIALSKKTRGPITELGRHQNTRESIEPLSGVMVLLVAETNHPDQIDVFLLDRPVCLFKNIWHATTSLSETALVKITENCTVESHSLKLPFSLDIGVVQFTANGGNLT